MAGHSTYLADAILEHIFQGDAWPSFGTSVYVSLHTGDPGLTGANEVSGGSYARVAVTRSATNFDEASTSSTNRQTNNLTSITFPAPTGTWGTCSHVGVWDASTSGNFLYGAALDTSRSPVNGDNAPSFAIGALIVKE